MNPQPLAPAQNPVECVSWLQREDLTRLALKAYEMARRDCIPPAGQVFKLDGDWWADRQLFRDCLVDNIALLVAEHGRQIGAWDSFTGMERLESLEASFRQRLADEAQAQVEADEVEP